MSSGSSEHAWALEAVAHIEDGLMVVDAEARVVYMNQAAERLAGHAELGDPRAWGPKQGVYHLDGRI